MRCVFITLYSNYIYFYTIARYLCLLIRLYNIIYLFILYRCFELFDLIPKYFDLYFYERTWKFSCVRVAVSYNLNNLYFNSNKTFKQVRLNNITNFSLSFSSHVFLKFPNYLFNLSVNLPGIIVVFNLYYLFWHILMLQDSLSKISFCIYLINYTHRKKNQKL